MSGYLLFIGTNTPMVYTETLDSIFLYNQNSVFFNLEQMALSSDGYISAVTRIAISHLPVLYFC